MKNKKAVSPVIGVILMVAITVILAALIAAFAFGMSGNIKKADGTYPGGHLIECSSLAKVTDVYKTPSTFVLSLSGYFNGNMLVSEEFYKTIHPGDYIQQSVSGWYKVNATPISEEASGYRDACFVPDEGSP